MTSMLDDDLEPQLRTLFRAQAATIDGARPASGDDVHVVELAEARMRRPRARRALVAAVAIAAAVSVIVAVRGGVRGAGPAAGGGNAVHWSTDYVDLSADDFFIDVGGQRYTAAGAQVDVHSDPGDRSYQTLELEWTEHGHEMRWYLYFHAAANQWWAFEMRTYNGRDGDGADWVTFPGEHFRSAFGQLYTGDLDLTATEGGVTSHLVATGLRLQAFLHVNTETPITPPTTAGSIDTSATPTGAAPTTTLAP